MTYSFVQKTENSNQNFAATSIACPAITCGVGNALILVAMSFDGNITITDGAVGNTYNNLGFVATPASGGRLTLFYAKNIAGGSTTITLNTTGPWIQGIGAFEYSGLDTAAPYIASSFVGQSQATPGTGTDACSSGNSNVTAVPAMLFGFNWDENNANADTPSSGTGFTGQGLMWKPLGSGGLHFTAQGQDKRITVTGNVAATFTSAVGSTDTLATVAAAFLEASGAVAAKPIGGVVPPYRRWIKNQYFQAAPRASAQQVATVTLSGQTVTFSQGALSAEIDVTLGAQTVALSQGALSIFNSAWQAKQIGGLVSPILGPLSNNLFRPVLRGIAAQAGGTLSGLTINTTTGSITATPTQFVTLTGQTINFTQGTISGADAATLGSQTATFSQGSVTASVSVTLGSQTIAITQQSLAVPIALSGQTIHFSQGSVGPQAQGSSGNRRMDFNFLGFGPIP